MDEVCFTRASPFLAAHLLPFYRTGSRRDSFATQLKYVIYIEVNKSAFNYFLAIVFCMSITMMLISAVVLIKDKKIFSSATFLFTPSSPR